MADAPMKMVDGVTMPMTEEEIAQMAAFAESADLDFDHFIRPERNGLLAGSDWTQLEDAPLSDEEKTDGQPTDSPYEIYRLRQTVYR